eukprot:2006374-Ditylum_brightwellii.AAC.1
MHEKEGITNENEQHQLTSDYSLRAGESSRENFPANHSAVGKEPVSTNRGAPVPHETSNPRIKKKRGVAVFRRLKRN